MAQTELEVLRIAVRPSPETNDREVCLATDEGDLISRFADGLMGMDPDQLLVEPCPLRAETSPRTAKIGRCECGIAECASVDITIVRTGRDVTWTTGSGPSA